MILFIGAVVIGLVLLAFASDQFVIGSSRIAVMARIAPIIIGAVVIGFGTSLPELLVTILAATDGSADIAVGNAVGSNIANLTLVLGAAALVSPLIIRSETIRREAPLSAAAVILLALLVQGGLGRPEGIALVVALGVALGLLMAWRRGDDDPLEPELQESMAGLGAASLRRESLRTLIGLAGTLAGAQLLVTGAQGISTEVGLSEGFVGLTIVAVGTSLPELFTGVQAARRGESDLIVGNVLGSNIFNSLGIAGVAALIDPGPLDSAITTTGAIAMAGLALLTWAGMATRGRLQRWEGAVLIVLYAGLVPLLV